jgi:DNA-binding beta-propeller fold protein YncE
LRAVEVFGERGTQAGQFNFPTGLAVDKRGILFVADSYNHRVQRITPNGGVAVIGGRGSGKGQFLSPQAVATDDWQAFYIVEQGNHRVQKYSAEGVLELMFGRPGHREGELQGPTAIAVAPGTGDIFVADTGNCRIQRFDCEGRFLGLIGGPGGSSPPLTSPQALAVDAADNLYVADTFAQRVVRYDPLGRFSGEYGGRFGVAGLPGAPVSQFHEPRALACDVRGALYVADSAAEAAGAGMATHGRIQALEAGTGAVRATVNAPGRGLGSLVRPSGLAVGPPRAASGRAPLSDLYASDTMNHRIQRFVWEEHRYG